jgi:N-acetylglucosaminyl-diphospho-decaprenol L-rhamnosyltransferase
MKLSIIIVSWNTADLLAQCLTSVYAYPPQVSFEVMVVDNASTDDSVSMLRRCFPQVELLINRQNIGFARANNQAIRQSRGEYLLLLNPDTEVKPNALQILVNWLDSQPQTGAVGPRTLNPDGSLQTSAYPAPTLTGELWRLLHLDWFKPYGVYAMATWPLDAPRLVDALLGACLLLRREVIAQVGPLDEDYFIYSEEIDLCYRLQSAGWQLYWLPTAQIVHYGGQSTRQVAAEMFLRLYQGKLLFFRKRHGWAAGLIYKLVLLFITLTRLAITPLVWLEPAPRRRQHLADAANYRRLLLALPGL